MLVDVEQAQKLFDALPAALRWPTLSPAYVAADARRDPSLQPLFQVADVGAGLLMHAVHESPIPDGTACDWQSAYGYGGPLVDGLDDKGLAQAWRRLDEDATQRRVVAEFVRFHPGSANHLAYPGTVRQDRRVTMVDLGVADLLASYSGRARTAVRKATRNGLRAAWATPAAARAAFPNFYRHSMTEIGASDFYRFDDDYFEALLGLPGARVLSVLRDDECLSMGLFLFGPAQVEYHLSGTSWAGRQAGATNLLLHSAAEAGQQHDCAWLYLGGGTSSRAEDPLLHFKASFAEPKHWFHIGHRIHDPRTYQRLRQARPDLASGSDRVLFYRKQ